VYYVSHDGVLGRYPDLEDPAGRGHFSSIPDVAGGGLPVAAAAAAAVVELGPGELLYLPAGWSHQVESAGRHIAVNFWLKLPLGILDPGYPCPGSRSIKVLWDFPMKVPRTQDF
jgi:hypothetical protein